MDNKNSGRRGFFGLADLASLATVISTFQQEKYIFERLDFVDGRDGQTYRTVRVGGQVWMAENLNYAAEGSMYYDNDKANGEKYGRLYDWETANKACPAGWHLPTDEEWTTLTDFVGDEETAGTKLKSASGWENNGNGIDEYGFSALPGGSGYSDGDFLFAGHYGRWWSATEYNADDVWGRGMGYDYEYVSRHNNNKTSLFSVRCLQD